MWFLSSVVAPIFVLGVLIVVHELGHFLAAKWCNVGVLRFAVGFGPALAKFRRGETVYQIGCIPLGGYVRMVGDMPDMITGEQPTDSAVRHEAEDLVEDEPLDPVTQAMINDRSRWFIEQPFWPKALIVFAGPAFNFILAILLVAGSVMIFGEEIAEKEPRIGGVMTASPAEKAGLQVGDLVVALNGTPVQDWETLAKKIHDGDAERDELVVNRGGQTLTLSVEPQKRDMVTASGKKAVYLIGIAPTTNRHDAGLFRALKVGVLWTANLSAHTYASIWGMFTGAVSPKDLAGPIFIFSAAGKQAKKGFEELLGFMALLSVSLGVLNLLPIPVLDGGHLLFFIIEAILGPISIRKKEFAQQIGIAFLLLLMVVAITNDIRRDPKTLSDEISWSNDKSSDNPEPAPNAADGLPEPAK